MYKCSYTETDQNGNVVDLKTFDCSVKVIIDQYGNVADIAAGSEHLSNVETTSAGDWNFNQYRCLVAKTIYDITRSCVVTGLNEVHAYVIPGEEIANGCRRFVESLFNQRHQPALKVVNAH